MSLFEVGSVLRLARDAWRMAIRLKQATTEYTPSPPWYVGPLHTCERQQDDHCTRDVWKCWIISHTMTLVERRAPGLRNSDYVYLLDRIRIYIRGTTLAMRYHHLGTPFQTRWVSTYTSSYEPVHLQRKYGQHRTLRLILLLTVIVIVVLSDQTAET